jgi:D-hydroxyproline dehydrogenase subunit gamma
MQKAQAGMQTAQAGMGTSQAGMETAQAGMGKAQADMDEVDLTLDGELVRVRAGISVAAALVNADRWAFRRSVTGSPRGPLCAMGICFECRVTINGAPHQRACLATVAAGMEVRTGE